MDKNKKIIMTASLALAFLLIVVYVFFPLSVGISDNGSVSYIQKGIGIEKKVQSEFFSKEYAITSSGDLEYYNGSMLSFLKPVKVISKMIFNEFNTGVLAMFYVILLLISLYLLLKYINFDALWKNITFAALLVFVFFDVAYLVYLNTLFQEGAFYVFLVLTVALYVKLIADQKPKIPTLFCYFVSAMVLTGIKPNMAIIGIVFAALGILLMIRRKGLTFRLLTVILTVMLLIQPFTTYKQVSNKEHKFNIFNSVFYGILNENKDVGGALKDLGLPNEYAQYAGLSAYDVTEDVVTNVASNLSYGKVASYYLKNPTDYFKKFNIAANNGFEIRPRYLGNYMQSAGKEANDLVGGFSLYSSVKRVIMPATLWFVWGIPLLLIAICFIFRKKDKEHSLFYYFIMGMSILSLIVFHIPMLTYGQADLGRHMAIYSAVFDVLFTMTILLLIHISALRRAEFKEKYGQTQ